MTERNCKKCIHHTRGNCDSWDCKMQTVEDVKKEAVKEYIKSVVEESEELKMRYFLTISNTGDEKSDFAYENVGNALDKAIEIVKQGGVSDDVCEWESIRDGEFIQNPHTRRTFSNEPSMQNVYCNTCGKKIKVVE